ncbi:MAG: putative sulfate exporter family transporter [Desulfatitalea sp.]|nr:putative sulfate exporter family transporter [Desulfatitalea sp.]
MADIQSTGKQQKNVSADAEAVVIDQQRWEWSQLWKKEDWWAIWLGFLLIVVGMIIFLPRPPAGMSEALTKADTTLQAEDARAPFRTVEWHKANDTKGSLRATNEPYAKAIAQWLQMPGRWSSNIGESLYLSEEAAARRRANAEPAYKAAQEATKAALVSAEAAQALAAAALFRDDQLNTDAEKSIGNWRKLREKERGSLRANATVQAYNKIPYLVGLFVMIGLFFTIGILFMNIDTAKFWKGFWFLFVIAVLAMIIGNQETMRKYGFGDVLWAIVLGMLISNTVGTPNFIKDGLQTEYFIKTGLVLLGAEILFSKIVAIGIPGVFVAWVVTPIVLVATYAFGQRVLKMESKTLNITVSADMCVCGVSAAIATASACRAKKEELTIAVGMSMLFTAIMMVALPTFIVSIGMHPVLGGAWIGGTIDSTGAVVAAGAFLGETGMFVAATIKMIQNVMIGVIAFGVAVYWCARVDCAPGQMVSKMEIWYRFPKFVLGFIGASVFISILYSAMGSAGDVMLEHGFIRGLTRNAREWFFALAFASIGLSSNFRELSKHFKGGKPVILYVCGQSLNLVLTLAMAYIMFFLVFPGITASL